MSYQIKYVIMPLYRYLTDPQPRLPSLPIVAHSRSVNKTYRFFRNGLMARPLGLPGAGAPVPRLKPPPAAGLPGTPFGAPKTNGCEAVFTPGVLAGAPKFIALPNEPLAGVELKPPPKEDAEAGCDPKPLDGAGAPKPPLLELLPPNVVVLVFELGADAPNVKGVLGAEGAFPVADGWPNVKAKPPPPLVAGAGLAGVAAAPNGFEEGVLVLLPAAKLNVDEGVDDEGLDDEPNGFEAGAAGAAEPKPDDVFDPNPLLVVFCVPPKVKEGCAAVLGLVTLPKPLAPDVLFAVEPKPEVALLVVPKPDEVLLLVPKLNPVEVPFGVPGADVAEVAVSAGLLKLNPPNGALVELPKPDVAGAGEAAGVEAPNGEAGLSFCAGCPKVKVVLGGSVDVGTLFVEAPNSDPVFASSALAGVAAEAPKENGG